MTDIYIYADETGDMDLSGQEGASKYFGVGTLVFSDQAHALASGENLRAESAAHGYHLYKGFHAKNDSYDLRNRVYATIGGLAPRFDSTLLLKANAYPHIKSSKDVHLYKLAWYLHFKEVVHWVSSPNDRVFVVIATLGTNKRKTQFETALHDVCVQQGPTDRKIVLCHWDAATSWGLQAADYCLWSLQRGKEKEAKFLKHLESLPGSRFQPWG
jgi:hypothetical protein